MTTQPLGIRELAEKAKENGAFDLAQGVIDAAPPTALIKQIKLLPLAQYSTYNNKRGVSVLREAVRKYLASRQWTNRIDSILISSGVTGATSSALLNHCHPGDTVLLPKPFFIGHKLLLETLGFKIAFFTVPLNGPPNWKKLAQQMKKAKALILTTPANPTGQVAPAKIIQRLSEIAAQTNCLLLLDEMYREFIWDVDKPDDSSYAELNLTNTVIMRSFSKTFAIPGWRVGFAVTSPKRIEQMAVHHDALYLGGSTIAQYALAAALQKNLAALNKYVVNLRQQLLRNRDQLADAFSSYGMHSLPVPATYYMLIKHHRKSDLAAMEELMAKKIVVTPLQILYADPTKTTGYIRIHFGVSPETVQGVADTLRGKN